MISNVFFRFCPLEDSSIQSELTDIQSPSLKMKKENHKSKGERQYITQLCTIYLVAKTLVKNLNRNG
jgi:hypothetical protein